MITTILLLAANSKETDPLRLAEEFREIKESLKLSENEDNFRVVQGEAIRPKDLRRLILETKPQIVHFSGHGSLDGIFLEGMFGKSQAVSGKALASLFKLFDSVHCVVLNACYSVDQAQAMVKVTPYIVGMKKPIGDRAAIQFSTGFYDGLGAELSIKSAFNFGVNAIELNRPAQREGLRTFDINEGSTEASDYQENIPVLLKGSIQRPLAVSIDEPEKKSEKKWSLSAFLNLPMFKIGFSVTLTLVVIASVMPVLMNYDGSLPASKDISVASREHLEPPITVTAPSIMVSAPPVAVAPNANNAQVHIKTQNQTHRLEVQPKDLVLFLGTAPKKLRANLLTLSNNLVSNQSIHWKSSDPSIASIRLTESTTRSALITAHKKGSVTIYINTNDLLDIISVTVKEVKE